MIRICSDPETLSREAAELFVRQARESVRERRRFCVALSGGQTPRRLYEILAGPEFRNDDFWKHTHVFWGDERCVPADDEQNNALMAQRLLLDHVSVPAGHVYPVRCEHSAEDGAQKYAHMLHKFFSGGSPVFDLILLGLGKNGHTASLFPGTDILEDRQSWTAPVYVKEQNMHRVTMMPGLINQARQVVFIVSGAAKAPVLGRVLDGPKTPFRLPAQLIEPDSGKLIWLVDQAAGRMLNRSITHSNPEK